MKQVLYSFQNIRKTCIAQAVFVFRLRAEAADSGQTDPSIWEACRRGNAPVPFLFRPANRDASILKHD